MISWTHYDQPVAHATLHFYRRATNRSKPPLVFCHGFSDNGLCFRRVAEALAPNYDVILVDTRNHGQSSSGEATADDLVEDLAEFVEALGLAPATFIGHSMGAGIVALLASRYPKSVRRIVLEDPAWFDTPLKNSTHSSEKHLAAAQKHLKDLAALTEKQLMALGRQLHPNWSEIEFPDWLTAKQQVHIMAAGGLERANWRELVPTITCPALVLYGLASIIAVGDYQRPPRGTSRLMTLPFAQAFPPTVGKVALGNLRCPRKSPISGYLMSLDLNRQAPSCRSNSSKYSPAKMTCNGRSLTC